METLSASLKLPSLPPSSSSKSQPLARSISHRFNVSSSSSAASTTQIHLPPSSSSTSHNKSPNFPRTISFQAKPLRASPLVYDKAASGFAAALVSVCQSKNCLGRTQEDVRRLIKYFLVGEEKKRNKMVLVNDVVVEERGKFGKHLKGLVKMLIAKGKLEILIDVLMEFERICDELVVVGSTTKLVWSS